MSPGTFDVFGGSHPKGLEDVLDTRIVRPKLETYGILLLWREPTSFEQRHVQRCVAFGASVLGADMAHEAIWPSHDMKPARLAWQASRALGIYQNVGVAVVVVVVAVAL